MSPAQFTRALSETRMLPEGKSTAAAWLVLVEGMSRKQAADAIGIDHAAVSKAVARIQPRTRCPHCQGTGYQSA